MEKQYLTVKEVADKLGVTPLTLRNWDKKGKLNAYRNPINNYRVYKREDVELFLRQLGLTKSQNVKTIKLEVKEDTENN